MQNQEECSLEERLVDIYFYIPENKSVDSRVSTVDTVKKANYLHTLYLLTFYTAATGATISERKHVSHSS